MQPEKCKTFGQTIVCSQDLSKLDAAVERWFSQNEGIVVLDRKVFATDRQLDAQSRGATSIYQTITIFYKDPEPPKQSSPPGL